MEYTINKAAVKLRNAAATAAESPNGFIVIGDRLAKLDDPSSPAGWSRVKVIASTTAQGEGFIQTDYLEPVPPAIVDEAIDPEGFFNQLGYAARTFGANREYLYALAYAESKVMNVKAKAGSAFGPFQFQRATWNGLVAKHGAETGISEDDIIKPSAQAVFAAILTAESQKALMEVIRRVPSAADLYLTHLLGLPAAKAVLQADSQRPIDVPLRAFYKGTSRGAAFVDEILAANGSLLTDGGKARPTEAVLAEVAKRLDEGLGKAIELATKYGPSPTVLPNDPGETPPWLSVARIELDKGIEEDKAPGGSNPEIEKYFQATSFGSAKDDTAWCAAFVSWCMANSGNDRVVAGNRRSARASDWLGWGFSVGRPVIGAVAVTRPLVAGSSGHVGFVVGTDDKTAKVTLLAGNQKNANGDDAVCEKTFNRVDIVGYRWLDWA